MFLARQNSSADTAAAEIHVEVRNLSKLYGLAKFVKPVVDNCSFTAERHKLTAIIGPSGCGKSTLMRLLAGFERPSSGTILVDGKPVNGPGKDRLVVFQETALFPWMTTYKNAMYGPRARGEDNQASRDRVDRLLQKVGLAGFRDKFPCQLSGGMQRRAELARALVNDPSIMILDEPFRGLDAMTKKLMLEYYMTLYEDTRTTTLFVTTDIDEAIFLADRLLLMSNAPTRVRAVVEVSLPRPRTMEEILESDAANFMKKEALSLLHEEAVKSFAGGSKATVDFIEAYSKRMQTN